MTDTARTEVAAERVDTIQHPVPRSSKRRMAREPKASRDTSGDGEKAKAQSAKAPGPPNPRKPSKIAMLIALLERPGGATLAEMAASTSWLPHTTRAALTGLPKKCHAIERDTRDDGTTPYTIAAS